MHSLLRVQGVLWADAIWERATLGGVLVAIGFLGLGSAWDVQWHAAVGRDTVWIPPHLMVYSGTALAAALAAAMSLRSALTYLWQGSRNPHPVRSKWYVLVGLGSASMAAAAAIDVLWHRTIGDSLAWSPPHVMGATGGVIIVMATIIAVLRPVQRRILPSALTETGLTLLLATLLLVVYYGLLSASVVALLPHEMTLAFITTKPYMLAGLASLMVPAAVAFFLALQDNHDFGRIAVAGAGLWLAVEAFHAVATPLVAELMGYTVRTRVIPDLHFKFLVLAFMLLPALVAHRVAVARPWLAGAMMGLLYSAGVAIWLRGLGAQESISVLGVAGSIALGAIGAVGGTTWGKRIKRYASASS